MLMSHPAPVYLVEHYEAALRDPTIKEHLTQILLPLEEIESWPLSKNLDVVVEDPKLKIKIVKTGFIAHLKRVYEARKSDKPLPISYEDIYAVLTAREQLLHLHDALDIATKLPIRHVAPDARFWLYLSLLRDSSKVLGPHRTHAKYPKYNTVLDQLQNKLLEILLAGAASAITASVSMVTGAVSDASTFGSTAEILVRSLSYPTLLFGAGRTVYGELRANATPGRRNAYLLSQRRSMAALGATTRVRMEA